MKKKRILNLYLFDGESAGSSAGEGVADPTADGNEKVVYGKAPEETTEPNNPSPESQPGEQKQEVDRATKFKELIKGEYKEEYKSLMQEQLSRRLKNQKPEVDPKQKEVMDRIILAYGTDDPDKLIDLLESDNRLFQSQADKQGITVEEYKRKLKLDIREAKINEANQKRIEDEESAAIYQKWIADSEAVKEIYPNFDLEEESENEDFTDLLAAGVPIQRAYEVIHMNDLMQNTAQTVANAVSKNTIENVRARGVRPSENGVTEQPGVVRKSNVNDLTDKDLDNIIARVKMGEKIEF